MAEPTGNDPKPTQEKVTTDKVAKTAKPETKSAAVKPPVLDLRANDIGPKKPDAKPAAASEASKPAEPPKPSVSEPPKKPAEPLTFPQAPKPAEPAFPIVATIGGGVLGLVAAYALAWAGLWPTPPAPTAPADQRIGQLASAVPELKTVTETTQSELATLTQRVGALEATPSTTGNADAPANIDLGPVEQEIASLTQRIDALAGAGQNAAEVDSLRGDLTGLGTRLDELSARVGTAEASLRTLDTSVSQTSASLANQPSDIGAVLQLPLILSGLETAFASGRPYETELAALRAAAPDAQVPTAIANNAASGLTRPDIVAARFADVLPAMLAGKPADPNAQWQDGAMDWFRSAIALRPTGELEGDTPEALMSQLESAVNRRDFTTADTLIQRLPQPMRSAAGTVPGIIESQAQAAGFLDTVRASALSGEAAQ